MFGYISDAYLSPKTARISIAELSYLNISLSYNFNLYSLFDYRHHAIEAQYHVSSQISANLNNEIQNGRQHYHI